MNITHMTSGKPGKQRLYNYKAPLHILSAMLCAHLSKELRQKLKRRSLRVRIGDKVVVMTGQYKKKNGKIERVDVKAQRVYITGIERSRKDGSKAQYPFHPSNLCITELGGEDKRRMKSRQPNAQEKKEKSQ